MTTEDIPEGVSPRSVGQIQHVDLPTLNVLSLCTGGGGLDLGLRLAMPTARTVCYVECEAYACEVLASRMENKALDDAPVWTDLRTFDGRPWRGVVDFITGGYPCQPFSVAGRRRGEDDPRHLWSHVLRIVQEVRPEWCLFENVANHLNLGYREVRRSLEEEGYQVTEGLFTAAEVGAPHRRQRLFILADAAARTGDALDGPREALRNQLGVCQPRLADTQGKCGQDGSSTEERSTGSSGGGVGMGHTYQQRLQGRDVGRSNRGAVDDSGRTGFLFPPRPGDLDGWGAVLKHAPALEPAVRGVVDGLANRVDQIRLLGNGVVPLAAAYAFHTLFADLRRRNTDDD